MINRRKFMSTAATFAAAAATSQFAFAEDKKETKAKEHGHHSGHGTGNAALAAAASNCVLKGEACLQHCMEMLTTGDTSMVDCSKAVREMLLYCQALSKAASQNSKHIKQLAKIAAET